MNHPDSSESSACEPLDPCAPDTALRVKDALVTYLHRAGGGHFGGCASCVDILLALCSARELACRNGGGDRLLLSKGHASMSLYAVLALTGSSFPPLASFGAFRTPLQGHPDRRHLPSLDFSFGSLGQGVAVGIGLAIGVRELNQHVWVVLGDGECQEGMVWEAAMLASRYRVNNLHVIVDANGEQECGWAHAPDLDQRPVPDDEKKWSAFGWRVDSADGHSQKALRSWIDAQTAPADGRPSVLLARTSKTIADSPKLSGFRRHHTVLTHDEVLAFRRELASRLNNP